MNFPSDPITKLRFIMKRLRSPQGCPWDQKQSVESLKPYLLEEAYEVIDALDQKDPDEAKGELGDLLLQIVFMAEIFGEHGDFDFDDIAESISQKLIRRHPHVFGDVDEDDIDMLNRQWEQIKTSEHGTAPRSALGRHQEGLPSLLSAQKITNKAARVGFDWPEPNEVIAQLEDEINELKEAIASENSFAVKDELGDILFTTANLGRHLNIDCETAMLGSITKFRNRFYRMEELIRDQQLDIEQLGIDSLNSFWQEAKKDVQAD